MSRYKVARLIPSSQATPSTAAPLKRFGYLSIRSRMTASGRQASVQSGRSSPLTSAIAAPTLLQRASVIFSNLTATHQVNSHSKQHFVNLGATSKLFIRLETLSHSKQQRDIRPQCVEAGPDQKPLRDERRPPCHSAPDPDLTGPRNARALRAWRHATGSTRHSRRFAARNLYMRANRSALVLESAGISTSSETRRYERGRRWGRVDRSAEAAMDRDAAIARLRAH
jgi:hypothetical protein